MKGKNVKDNREFLFEEPGKDTKIVNEWVDTI